MYQKLYVQIHKLKFINDTQMNDYSHPKYNNLYEEILKDYQWTWGKFNPIPYPFLNRIQDHESQRNNQTSK